MDILSFQKALKALKRIGMVGRKAVDDSTLQDGFTPVYSSELDKYITRKIDLENKIADWIPDTQYTVDDFFVNQSKIYRALVDHTSTIFEQDLSNGRLELIGGGNGGTGTGGVIGIEEILSVGRESILPAGQPFLLPPDMHYQVGINQLNVQIDNNPLLKNVDWFENDSTSISFNFDLPVDWSLFVRKFDFVELPEDSGLVGTKTVDESNISDGAILKYNQATDEVVYGEAVGGTKVHQIVKLDRKVNDVDLVPFENDGKIVIDAFKLIPGEESVVVILKDFNNSEAENFIYDETKVEFDGAMKLKTLTETKDMVFVREEEDGAIYEVELDFSGVGKLLSLEVVEKVGE